MRIVYGQFHNQILHSRHIIKSYTPVTYRLAAKTMSRFIAFEAESIFLCNAEFPIMAAAFLNSRHVSSNLTMVRTIRPSGTSVSSHISANGVPCKNQAYNLFNKMCESHNVVRKIASLVTDLCPLINDFDQAKFEILLGIFFWVYL